MEHRRLNLKKVLLLLVIIALSSGIIIEEANKKHEVPYYKQEMKYYCGEACIRMILDYYHIYPLPTQSEIAIEANYRENQTYANDMSKPFIIRNMWYKVSANNDYELAYKELIEIISKEPVIILITWKDGSGHYLVIYDGNYDGIKYHDPNNRNDMYITKDELKYLWHDYCINFPRQPVCWMLIVHPVARACEEVPELNAAI